MNSLDFFFYSFVTFQVKVLKRDLDDSRWSAALMTSLFVCFFISAIFMTGSIFFPNDLADIYVNGKSIWLGLVIVVAALVIWRFFYFVTYESLVVKRRKIKYVWVYHLINWLIVIGGSILSFVAFRLYKYGYV